MNNTSTIYNSTKDSNNSNKDSNNSNSMSYDGNKDGLYIHFANNSVCLSFYEYALENKIQLGHKCCGGKGFLVKQINGYTPTRNTITDITNKFLSVTDNI